MRLRGADEASRALWLAELARGRGAPLVVLEADGRRLRQLEANLRFFLGAGGAGRPEAGVYVFPAWDVYPYARLSPSSENVGERMAALDFLMTGGAGIVLTTPEALSARISPPARLRERVRTLREGAEVERDALLAALEELGYQRRSIVESPGECAVRGGIVDFYSPREGSPVRLEMRGDEIDSLREFHPQTQRTLRTRAEVRLFPAREILLTPEECERGAAALRARGEEEPALAPRVERLIELLEAEGRFSGLEGLAPFFLDEMGSFFDAVPGDALWVIHEPEMVSAAARKMWAELEDEAALAPERGLIGYPPGRMWMEPGEVEAAISLWPRFELDPLGLDAGPGEEDREGREDREEEDRNGENLLLAERLTPIRGRIAAFVDRLLEWRAAGEAVTIVAADRTEALRIQSMLREYELGVPFRGTEESLIDPGEGLDIAEGRLSSSFRLPREGRVFFRAEDLFVSSLGRQRRRAGRARPGEGLRDLKAEDYVVHVDHGIGQYKGTQILEHAEGEDEFLTIAYSGGDKLYVPMDDVDRVTIHRGGGERPLLDKLGGPGWAKTKRGVKKALQTIARDLLRLYTERQAAAGFSFPADGSWDQEIASGLEYEETPDQDQAIREVLADMERPRPMDRLVCGDVGYGKTEVALRAAARAVSSGKQVALIVPTTLLAHQHQATFSQRYRSLPVRVEMLSRFRSRKEQAEVVAGLASGEVDIVIGTHRIFQKDVAFKDLGLLIIDEEHRFGVSHKEKLKKLSLDVDVLSMTATPIPRTLQLALSNARDLSVIETPPRRRLAPRTYISRFNEKVVRDAITREIDRGGQVFFVHNRVRSLPAMERFLERIVPQARVLVAHGQMPERRLEEVMEKFVSRKADVLLCTTIIESGLDIPSVNTILINRADYFGMAQLYQLRGRVGRDRFRAHAYLLVPGSEGLTREARERLQALEELSELGAGFKLAARDLEIRGAGHLLGHRQSGHIASVGFEMYCQLLDQVMREARGGGAVERREPDISAPVTGSLPPGWMPAQAERLEVYRRVAAAASPAEIGEIERGLADQFGPLP
ncbi:MAG: transcription-repair coupling factor, partial [bacterium]